ncbi:hypothetical protein G6F65_014098 [Rhizopus arrhizus]|nr:hypothetical protein G6F65_014098 [Rhizopus arrhizus]
MAGIRIAPTANVVATLEPATAAKIMQVKTQVQARPPWMPPTTLLANSTMRSLMSTASIWNRAAGTPASSKAMAMEYGSSPVEAAQHHTDTGPPRFCAKSARMGKWCDSRKNAVRLVVSALTKSSHSAASGSFSS